MVSDVQLPVAPPNFDALLQSTIARSVAKFARRLNTVSEVDRQARYLQGDKLRHLPAPEGFSSEQWWLGFKMARRTQGVYRILTVNLNSRPIGWRGSRDT